MIVAVSLAAMLATTPAISARSARSAKHARSAESSSPEKSSKTAKSTVTAKSTPTANSARNTKSTRAVKSTRTYKSSRTTKTAADDTAGTPSRTRHGKTVARSSHMHGQQAIDPARVTEIQQALIREHYLTSEASGSWDSETIAAMEKYQADNGWQTKLMPDSRALKKLGLGPDYSNAINASGSSFVAPAIPSSTSSTQASDFAAAAGVSQ